MSFPKKSGNVKDVKGILSQKIYISIFQSLKTFLQKDVPTVFHQYFVFNANAQNLTIRRTIFSFESNQKYFLKRQMGSYISFDRLDGHSDCLNLRFEITAIYTLNVVNYIEFIISSNSNTFLKYKKSMLTSGFI